MSIITETPHLIIRAFTLADELDFMALFADPLVTEHLPPRTVADYEQVFKDILALEATGSSLNRWAIIGKAGGEFIGMGLLRNFDGDPDFIEVGYCLNVPFWGKGHASELCKALVAHAKTLAAPHVKAIVAVTTLTNYPSQQVLQKAGLVKQPNRVLRGEEIAFFEMLLT